MVNFDRIFVYDDGVLEVSDIGVIFVLFCVLKIFEVICEDEVELVLEEFSNL